MVSESGGEAVLFDLDSALRIWEISSEACLVRPRDLRMRSEDVLCLCNREGEQQNSGEEPDVDVEVLSARSMGVLEFIRVCKLLTLAVRYVVVRMLPRSLDFKTCQHRQCPL